MAGAPGHQNSTPARAISLSACPRQGNWSETPPTGLPQRPARGTSVAAMTIYQSRSGTTVLASLVVASVVAMSVVGCSTHPATPTGSSTISTSAPSQALVDVSAVWATHPMPPCPRVIIGNQPAPAGLELPSDESVAQQLAGVKSPATEGWVRMKLGWVTKWLAKVRADIISDPASAGSAAEKKTFDLYVKHVGDELREGQDSSSPPDSIYPEGCM